jgi:hypothetical protein
MATWPVSLPLPEYGLEEEFYQAQIRNDFEAGYVISRPRFTRGRRRWKNLGWLALSEANYEILLAFFTANQGGSFSWTHPASSVTYTCRFSGDNIMSQFHCVGWRKNIRCPIEQV